MSIFFELINDYEEGHSQYQIDNFITKMNGGSLYGQYKQALRELHTRFIAVRQLYFKRERLIIDIEELETEIRGDNYFSRFDKNRAKLDLNEKRLLLDECDISFASTEKEFKRFLQQCIWLKNEIGPINEESKKKLEEDAWLYWTKEKLAVELITHGNFSLDSMKMLHSSSQNVKENIFNSINNKILIDWYQDNNNHITIPDNLPDISLPTKEEVMSLT